METIVSGRQFEVDGALRDYVEEKVAGLAAEYNKLTTARVVLSEERGRHIVEGHVSGKHITLNATGRSHVPAEAVDEVFQKLERQLRKHVDRLHDHRTIPLNEAEMRDLEEAAAKAAAAGNLAD
jgi:putative sigma-54 modulation protein